MLTELLHDLPDLATGEVGDLAAVEARLAARSRQTGDGLHATLALTNGARRAVELVNPFDLHQWELLDEAGAPLELPRRAPNLRVHRPASAPWKLSSAVPLVEVRRDGEGIDAAALDSATVLLAPQVVLAVTFELSRILEDGSAVELASGEYRLACLATLIDAVDTQRSRIVRCRPLSIRFDRA